MSLFPASAVKGLIDIAERRYGLSPSELLGACALPPDELRDPSAMVPLQAFERVLRFVLLRTGDEALGLHIAQESDLRAQGFWGYAMLSSTTVAERLTRNVRYGPLRGPVEGSLSVVGDVAQFDIVLHGFSVDLEPVLIDGIVASGCVQLGSQLNEPLRDLQVELAQRERPHHRELRAMVRGPIFFSAGRNRIQFAGADLHRPLSGDPFLGQLATSQLDAQLEALKASGPSSIIERVHSRVAARLHDDASLERVAADLGVSVRTLQRMLEAHGTSFQDLVTEVRRVRARAYLLDTDESIERIAVLVGYGEPSAFRRAFMRWTGCSPSAFREARGQLATAEADATSVAASADGSERTDHDG